MKKQSEKFLDYKEKVVTLQAPSRMVSEPVLSYDLLIWRKLDHLHIHLICPLCCFINVVEVSFYCISRLKKRNEHIEL